MKSKKQDKHKKKAGGAQTGSKLTQLDDEIKVLESRYATITAESIQTFEDLPLSQRTLKGLRESQYKVPTPIQRESIGPALQGRNVIGTATTGAGKTLAFLIPVLERLYVRKWSRGEGVCAIIISPTRELALQTFNTLTKIGKRHDFSADLLVGGQNLKAETRRMDQFNILVCTPGRLLQHLEQNVLLDTSTLELLVLDEADRCMDEGFERELNLIIEHFTSAHQTLLYSATMTGNLAQLIARLQLSEPPVYVGMREHLALPGMLRQSYVIVPLADKLAMLWSFLRSHRERKCIVFMASCKQVKYVYELFCKLRPGISLLAIYGTLHQQRRIATYEEFLRKRKVVLFATDIASRGLDFPHVDWIVQLDCPEDVPQYVHRAGRSARNNAPGESVLVLLPNEAPGMLKALDTQLIRPQLLRINPKFWFTPAAKISAYLAQLPELKQSAVRAFNAYLKSVYLMRNKQIFDVLKLDVDAYAHSLGLALMPDVPILQKIRYLQAKTTGAKLPTAVAVPALSESDDDDDEDFIKLKSGQNICENTCINESGLTLPTGNKVATKAAKVKKLQKRQLQLNQKIVFNEQGERSDDDADAPNELGGIDIERARQLLREQDQADKERQRKLLKEQKRKAKHKAKNAENDDDEEEVESDEEALASETEAESAESEAESAESEVESSESEAEPAQPKKSKRSANKSSDLPPQPSKKVKLAEKLSLEFTEDIALQLLQNS